MHATPSPPRGDRCRSVGLAATLALAGAFPVLGADYAPPRPGRPADEDLSGYRATPASGAVAALQQRLDKGDARLDYSERHGYLPSLLRELKVPVTSQLLVASKTSPNKHHISPKNPRALYFNDAVALAYVPGAEVIEVVAVDPRLGNVFYSLAQKPAERPRLVRDDRCLECHASAKTLEVPGWLVRSFETHADGDVDVLSGLMVTHRTPIADRWGGYYVTGDTGGQRHRGNVFGAAPGAPSGATVTNLAALLDVSRFPAESSDVVALLVLEHQVHALNLITRLAKDAGELKESEPFDRAHPATEALLKYLLFTEEAPLATPVRGGGSFMRQFEALGPADARGRSLRHFDLQRRLFKHPCSFMIYSPSFDALPVRARRHFYRRLWDILAGEDTTGEFTRLTPESRQAVREILLDTRKDLPAYWRL